MANKLWKELRLSVEHEGPSAPTDPQLGDKWHDTNSGNTFTWNGEGWVQEGFDPEHPVP